MKENKQIRTTNVVDRIQAKDEENTKLENLIENMRRKEKFKAKKNLE